MSTPNTQAGSFRNRFLAGGAIAAIALSFALTALVMANNLHQANDLPISWDDQNFQGSDEDCKDADLAPGEVLWHFVHTGNDGADLPATLDATFTDAGPQQADGYSNGGGNATLMYDIITPGHDTLESASDSINDDNLLNLSHICVGPEESVAESASAEQSVEGSTSESVAESEAESIAESVDESVAESAEQSVEGSTEESVAESEAESIAESVEESVAESAEQSVEGSTSESVAESAEQSVEASTSESVAESAEQSVEGSTSESVAESEEASGEQSVEAGTGTPKESTPDGSLFGNGNSPLSTIAFSLILLGSLGGLAYANVKTVRNRN